MKQPFFSIVIPTYNRRDLLEKCVNSVLNQTFTDFEIIVIDDGSKDGTGEFIASLETRKINLKYRYHKNHGVSFSRNKGIKVAKGKWIAFLDSDDWWKPTKLERIAEYINKYPDIKIFHTEEIWYQRGRLLPQKVKHKKPTGFVYKHSLPLCCISLSTAVVAKEVFDDIGLFDETMEACEDYDLWLRITAKYEVKLVPETLTLKDGGRPDQLSVSVWGLDRYRIMALDKMLSSGTVPSEYYDLTLKELKKKCAIFAEGCKKRDRFDDATAYLSIPHKYDK